VSGCAEACDLDCFSVVEHSGDWSPCDGEADDFVLLREGDAELVPLRWAMVSVVCCDEAVGLG
jgi:hypothetical protein